MFVECDDGARAFHANDVLNRAADAEREIQLGCNRLAGGTDLAVHGMPAIVADGTRGGEIGAECVGQLLGDFDVFLFFDAAAYGHDHFGLGEVDGLLGFFKYFLRHVSHHAVGDIDFYRFNRGGTCAVLSLVPAKSAVLKCGEPRSIAGKADVGGQFALKHLPGKKQFAVFVLEADAIADDGASHGGGQLGDEVSHLISLRPQYELGLLRGDVPL